MELTKQDIKDITLTALLANDTVKKSVEEVEERIISEAKSGSSMLVLNSSDYDFNTLYYIVQVFNLKGYQATVQMILEQAIAIIKWEN